MRERARLIDGEKSKGCPVAFDGKMQGETAGCLPRERPILCRDAFVMVLSYRISIIRRFPPGTCRRPSDVPSRVRPILGPAPVEVRYFFHRQESYDGAG